VLAAVNEETFDSFGCCCRRWTMCCMQLCWRCVLGEVQLYKLVTSVQESRNILKGTFPLAVITW